MKKNTIAIILANIMFFAAMFVAGEINFTEFNPGYFLYLFNAFTTAFALAYSLCRFGFTSGAVMLGISVPAYIDNILSRTNLPIGLFHAQTLSEQLIFTFLICALQVSVLIVLANTNNLSKEGD